MTATSSDLNWEIIARTLAKQSGTWGDRSERSETGASATESKEEIKQTAVTGPVPAALRIARVFAAKKSQKKASRVKFRVAGRGKGFNPRVGDVVDYGKKAWNAIKEIKRMINVEEKMFDTSLAATAVTYSGRIDNLTNIAQGNDYNNRDGNSILVQKLELRGYALSNSTIAQATTGEFIRVMILRDMLQTAGADPAVTDVLENTGDAYAPFSQLTHRHDGNPAARRFRILMDETRRLVRPWATTVTATTAGNVDLAGPDTALFHVVLDVNAHTLYSGTTGADASDYVGALYVLAISNVVTNGPFFAWRARVYFTDN